MKRSSNIGRDTVWRDHKGVSKHMKYNMYIAKSSYQAIFHQSNCLIFVSRVYDVLQRQRLGVFGKIAGCVVIEQTKNGKWILWQWTLPDLHP